MIAEKRDTLDTEEHREDVTPTLSKGCNTDRDEDLHEFRILNRQH